MIISTAAIDKRIIFPVGALSNSHLTRPPVRRQRRVSVAGEIAYKTHLDGVDWEEMKAILAVDNFDNGRTPEQLCKSFENCSASVVAYDGVRHVSAILKLVG
jgi:hypothetical protein